MKILVDEMPTNASECIFGKEDNWGDVNCFFTNCACDVQCGYKCTYLEQQQTSSMNNLGEELNKKSMKIKKCSCKKCIKLDYIQAGSCWGKIVNKVYCEKFPKGELQPVYCTDFAEKQK